MAAAFLLFIACLKVDLRSSWAVREPPLRVSEARTSGMPLARVSSGFRFAECVMIVTHGLKCFESEGITMATLVRKTLRAHCQQELDRLDDDGLVIARQGGHSAKLVRFDSAELRQRDLRRLKRVLKGKIKVVGDIEALAHPYERRLGQR